MQAVILAGGKGTRLAERLGGLPKPLVDVCGTPLLERQLDALFSSGIEEVLLLVNHRADLIQSFVDSHPMAAKITLVDDGEPQGTAGALLAALPLLRERFVVVYGDTLFDIDLPHFIETHHRAGADVSLLVHPNDHPADSDLVEVDGDGWIQAFHGYPHPPASAFGNLVNAAMYVCERRALEAWADFDTPSDLAKNLFPHMLAAGARLLGYESYEYIKDLGTPERLDKVERHLRMGRVARASRRAPQRAVFVDRDGTLNVPAGYIKHPDQLVLIAGAAEGVRRLNEAEYRVVLATNQPVLARGECDDATMRRIHARLQTDLGHSGAYLDRVLMCPHHPQSGFPGEVSALKGECDCRKPKPGMLLAAAADLNIDLTRSWMVGDASTDMACAAAAGVTSVLVLTGDAGQDGRVSFAPDFVVADFGQAAELIVKRAPALMEAIASELGDPEETAILLDGTEQARRSVQAVLRMSPKAERPTNTSRRTSRTGPARLNADALSARFFKDIGR